LIKIGKSHTLFHDGTCWVLIEHSAKARKGKAEPVTETTKGEPVGQRSYFTDVHVALKRVISSRMKGARTVEGLEKKLADAYADVIAVGSAIQKVHERAIEIALAKKETE